MDNVPYFSLDGKTFDANCINCYDGDTVTVVFKFHDEMYKWKIRLAGIRAHEIKTKDKFKKELGIKARDFIRSKILNKDIKLVCGDFDCFGRVLGTIYLDGININELMILEGYAIPY